VVAGCIVAPALAKGAQPQHVLAEIVDEATHATGQGFEIRDGEYYPPIGFRHPGHFGDGLLRRIEMIHRPLADTGIENGWRKGQPIGPAPNPIGLRTGFVGCEELSHAGHSGRGLGPHRARASRGQGDGVLAHPARHIEHPQAGGRPGSVQGDPGHSLKEKFAIRREAGGNHVAHVPVEVYNAHDAAK